MSACVCVCVCACIMCVYVSVHVCVCVCVCASVCMSVCLCIINNNNTMSLCAWICGHTCVLCLPWSLYMCPYLFACTNIVIVSTGKHTLQLVQVNVTVTNLANTETDFQWPVWCFSALSGTWWVCPQSPGGVHTIDAVLHQDAWSLSAWKKSIQKLEYLLDSSAWSNWQSCNPIQFKQDCNIYKF